MIVAQEPATRQFSMRDEEEIWQFSRRLASLDSVSSRMVEPLFVEFASRRSATGSLVGSFDSSERLGAAQSRGLRRAVDTLVPLGCVFRDAFLSLLPSGEFEKLAGKRAHTLWEVIVVGAEAYLSDKPLVMSDIHVATRLARTTAWRSARILEHLGIFRLHADKADRRRKFVEFTAPFQEQIDRYVDTCFEEFEELITSHHDRERHNAERELRDSEMRWESLVRESPDRVIL